MRHWMAHLFGWNLCEPLLGNVEPGQSPETWRVGHRCLGCGEETWWDLHSFITNGPPP